MYLSLGILLLARLAWAMQESEQIEFSPDNDLTPTPHAIAAMADYNSPNDWPDFSENKLHSQYIPFEIRAMLSDIEPRRINNTIAKLVSFGTRHTMSTQTDPSRGIGAAKDWIAREMASYTSGIPNGRLVISVETQEQEPSGRITRETNISNIIGTMSGTSDPNRVYVVTAHYDSINSDLSDTQGDAPGANDNASGVAMMLELCRILAARRTAPKATIIFAAVAGEEQGLFGSHYLAKSLKERGVDVQGVLNNDIVGSPVGANGEKQPRLVRVFAQGLAESMEASHIRQVSTYGEENDSLSRQLARFIHDVAANDQTGMDIQIVYRTDRYGRGGDHQSFLKYGFPAIRFVEPVENLAHQHQKVFKRFGKQYGDTIEFIDPEYISRVAKVNMVALWALANGPGFVRDIRLKPQGIASLTNITFINPKGVEDGSISGCELVWRPTVSSKWTNSQGVQPCEGFITTTLNQDNVVFGVRAIGSNGVKGPISAVSAFA